MAPLGEVVRPRRVVRFAPLGRPSTGTASGGSFSSTYLPRSVVLATRDVAMETATGDVDSANMRDL
jgi:hypothetical protein